MGSETNWLEFFEDREQLHADFYLDFAQQHARRDPEAYDELEAESGNWLKAAAWLSSHNEAEGIFKLATVLWQQSDFIRTRGFLQRGLPLLEQAHQAARQLGDSRAEFIWLEALANVHYSSGNPALAQPMYEQALTMAQDLNEPQLKAQVQLGMGRLLMDMGQLDKAAVFLKKALADYRQVQDYEGEITALTALGNLLSLQGDFSEAVAYLEQGLPVAQAKQDRYSEVALRFALGYVGTAAQDWPMAIKHYEPAIAIAQAIGDRFFEVRGLHNLGEAWLELGKVQHAVSVLEEALTRQETLDDVLTKAFTHLYLAKAYNLINAPEKSLAQLRYVYPFRQVPVLVAQAVEATWIKADNYLKLNQINLARIALLDVLDLAPDNMAEIRRAATGLLESIALGEYE